MKTYIADRNLLDRAVKVDYGDGNPSLALPPRNDLFDHSPDGFEWGYGGSGPAQLALALLCHVLEDDARAVRLHQEFKFKVVGGLPREGWTLTEEYIRSVVAEIDPSPPPPSADIPKARSDAERVKHPEECPNCGSTQIEGGSYNTEGASMTQEMLCVDCGCDWRDWYRLEGYSHLENEDGFGIPHDVKHPPEAINAGLLAALKRVCPPEQADWASDSAEPECIWCHQSMEDFEQTHCTNPECAGVQARAAIAAAENGGS